ncbi:hypothetical protein [Rhodoferax antarcticus]|uniref:Uncharacterized protein n=1 Tax=Rhodoferax antarcticus ANT.BR TaxID=1111071 RepID=A0A1Q8YCE3_9BURK|nr:hypothetical protein [Rhodoferax antarcticus]MCW2314248.1 hypothetical protein [Rhodoferax antarcticus]OLP05672.1 hypothetical protein BLL52_3045 [Rhodoferax antarcticus ANT.BR]
MPPVTPTAQTPLTKPLRTQLENTVKCARDVAEKGSHQAPSTCSKGRWPCEAGGGRTP